MDETSDRPLDAPAQPAATGHSPSIDRAEFAPSAFELSKIVGRSMRYAGYQALDRVRNRAAGSTTRVPWHFDAVTPEWLTGVLCRQVPGAAVTSVRSGIGHVGTSGRRQFLLDYNTPGKAANLPVSVFAKGTPTLVTRISMGTVPSMRIEADFYNRVRPLLDLEAPAGYYSAYDLRSGRSIHLIEDLARTKGATFPAAATRISRDMAEGIVLLLAALHSRFLESPLLTRDFPDFLTWPEEFGRMARPMNLRKYHFKGLDKARAVLPDVLIDKRDETWGAIEYTTRLHRSLPHTLTHGDVHLGNWYVTDAGRIGLLDWQCVSKGHWSRDLAYAITSTLSIADRREWEDELLKLYAAEMTERTGIAHSYDAVRLRYRQQVFGALAFWTPTYAPPAFAPKNMQPEALGLEMIRRFATAIADLDSFGSLEETA